MPTDFTIGEIISIISEERCTVDEAEALLNDMVARDPYFFDSDMMLSLVEMVKVRPRATEILSTYPGRLTKDQLIEVVRKAKQLYAAADGSSLDEADALREVFVANVFMPSEQAGFVFSQAAGDATAEEIVEQALSYKPILL